MFFHDQAVIILLEQSLFQLLLKKVYYMEKRAKECPVKATLNLISDKWKVLIIHELINGSKRSNELEKSLSGISRKVLTENLRSLEENDIISRVVYPEAPPRVEYSLTSLGESLLPILYAIAEWGEHYLQHKSNK